MIIAMEQGNRLTHEKPRTLLVDCSHASLLQLAEHGWRCEEGTFGLVYQCERDAKPFLVTRDTAFLPDLEEQDVVVVDTRVREIATGANRSAGTRVAEWWLSGASALIDQRPIAMAHARSACDRVLEAGGLFVVFLSIRSAGTYMMGTAYQAHAGTAKLYHMTDRGFLGVLDACREKTGSGTEIRFGTSHELGRMLGRYSGHARYLTTIPDDGLPPGTKWTPIAWNKFEECVAGILRPSTGTGLVLVLPEFDDTAIQELLPQLLSEWAVEEVPALFPEHSAHAWLNRDEYEHTGVLVLRQKADKLRSEYEYKRREIEQGIERIREKDEHLHALLTATGDELVSAVIASLRELGFTKVVDVDEECRREGKERDLREDIRIEDASPLMVVDVRGLSGIPADEDLTQADKHALMRSRELDRTDVRAMTLINTERNLPPSERNLQPFREEMVKNAMATESGLMTTWDLFRLLRSTRALGWSLDVVQPILYRTGWVQPIPSHYEQVGTVERLWRNAFGITPTVQVATRDRLSVSVADSYVEFPAVSIQVDDTRVEAAPPGTHCGIAYDGAAASFRKGACVYRVTNLPRE